MKGRKPLCLPGREAFGRRAVECGCRERILNMKYGMNARVYAWAFTKLLREYYAKNAPDQDLGEGFRGVKREYRQMVLRTPGLGGSSNEANLIGACYFFAMARVIPGMTPERMDDIIQKCIRSDLMVKLHQGQKKMGTLFSRKEQEKKLAEAESSHHSPYEMDWEFTYQPGDNEFYLTYTKCGICALAKKEQMEDYLPCLCRMDFPKYELVGARLIRTKTLAAGDDCCNFHVIRE